MFTKVSEDTAASMLSLENEIPHYRIFSVLPTLPVS
jgi:hypothetical protein